MVITDRQKNKNMNAQSSQARKHESIEMRRNGVKKSRTKVRFPAYDL